MKNKYWFTILTAIVAAVFLLSFFSPLSAAQKPADRGNQEKFNQTVQAFLKAKAELAKATSKEDRIIKAKVYLGSAIDRIDSDLDVLKSRAENPESQGIIPFDVSKNIDAHVAELEQLKKKAETDNTIDELRADNQELKDKYSNIKLERRYGIALLLNNTLDKIIRKADNVTAKMNAEIQNLNNKSIDTSTLVTIRGNFTNLMQEAAADQQNTEKLLATHTGFDDSGMVINNTDAQAFIKQVDDSQRETIKILRAAFRQEQEFVRDYRRLSGGNAAGEPGNHEKEPGIKTLASGNSTLVANGSGRAIINGNVTVMLSGINGTLIVSNNANVTADGGMNQTLGNGQVQYREFNSAAITGDNIKVAISGNNFNFTVICTAATTACTAVLSGNGTFGTSGTGSLNVSGEWSKGRLITVTPPDE